MRKLVVSVLTSLDGYYEGPGKDLSGVPFEDVFNDHNLGLLRRAGTMVYGSTWFEQNWTFWSAVASDPSANERDREIASIVTSIDALIISDSMTRDENAPWAANTTIVSRADGPGEIERLKQQDGGDLLMFGSAVTWSPLLQAGLVDELIVLIGAGLLGDGAKLYSGPPAGLRLLEAHEIPGSGLVRLRYAPAPLG
jgi:hypothetical protein